MRALDKNLTIVSEPERAALYGRPDFDDFQRAEYFALTAEERTLVQSRVGLSEQISCILQISYFKAKQAFFQFRSAAVPPEDIDFLMRRYFPDQTFRRGPVRQTEYYLQRKEILRLFGYRPWSQKFMPLLSERAAQQVRRDVTPAFILTELIALLRQKRIIRPGYNMQARWGREALRGAIVHITPCSNTYSGAVATFYQVCGQHWEGYQQPGGIAPRLVLALGSSRLGH